MSGIPHLYCWWSWWSCQIQLPLSQWNPIQPELLHLWLVVQLRLLNSRRPLLPQRRKRRRRRFRRSIRKCSGRHICRRTSGSIRLWDLWWSCRILRWESRWRGVWRCPCVHSGRQEKGREEVKRKDRTTKREEAGREEKKNRAARKTRPTQRLKMHFPDTQPSWNNHSAVKTLVKLVYKLFISILCSQ